MPFAIVVVVAIVVAIVVAVDSDSDAYADRSCGREDVVGQVDGL